MSTIKWQSADLDAGIPVMYRDFGHVVRAAYDPEQITFDEARVLLAVFCPQTVGATE
ncbi:hypothetical protein ACFY3G_14820 [Streptomyces phaeochromogenes]|uniref:hypothetical protein n=1 Tax=Streptomyces phaeochromogenes TaxID=1923 RepID=UPI0036A6E4ED